jgi:predicted RNase H-like HicB family nuclease
MIPVRIVLQNTGHGFSAQVPGLGGINAHGETEALCINHARQLIRERLLGKEVDENVVVGRSRVIDLNPPLS